MNVLAEDAWAGGLGCANVGHKISLVSHTTELTTISESRSYQTYQLKRGILSVVPLTHAHGTSKASTMSSSSDLAPREALSGILGSISLSCWLFLLVPQLLENYRNSSAEAVSLTFIFVWFIGDVANLVGAVWAGLVPVIIAIAVYFCIADGVLISQCLYYRRQKTEADEGDDQPLLPQPEAQGAKKKQSEVWKNIFSILGVIAVGTMGWTIAWQSGVWTPTEDENTDMAVGAQILGYLSAILYLGARIPQIIKNTRSKSCEGMYNGALCACHRC